MTSRADLSCKELVELVTDYLEGALTREDRIRFDKHIGECPGCETYLDQMRQVIGTLGKLNEDSIPAAAKEPLLQIFRNWKQSRQP